jgi:hypothetical protein
VEGENMFDLENAEVGDEIEITIRAKVTSTKNGGSLRFSYADCFVKVGEEGELADVGGTTAGGYEFADKPSVVTFYVGPKEMYRAWRVALGEEEPNV